MNNLVNDYVTAKENIFDYFGYVEQWRAFPIEVYSYRPWMIIGGEGSGGQVVFSMNETPFTEDMIIPGKQHSAASIYTYRHLQQWIWRKPERVMILGDTHCDGNILLMIFDAKLECKDQKLIDCYKKHW